MSISEEDDSGVLSLTSSVAITLYTFTDIILARYDYVIVYTVSKHKQYGHIAPLSLVCRQKVTTLH